MKIEDSGLRPDTQNANEGTQRGLGLLDKSLRKLGAGRSILVDKNGNVIAGNKTLERAADIDLPVRIIETDGKELVAVKRTDLDLYSETDKRARELAYADNKVAELDLAWKPEQIALDYEPLDLGEWGFEDPDPPVADTEPQIDRAAELNEKWQVKTGDLWQIGEHRLLCGDSTKREDVDKVMGGEKADMVFTDPPYGMNLNTDYTQMPECKIKSNTYSEVIGDDVDFDPRPLLELFNDIKEQFWWGGDYYYNLLPSGGSWVVWDKRNEGSDGLVGNHFEVCWSKQKHRREMKRFIWSGFTARERDSERMHPTQKPVKLCESIIEPINTITIIDPYAGSGTTMVACQNLSRKCRAIEISPNYCAVILERMNTAFPDLKIERI